MCGIIAYSGTRPAVPLCLEGLTRLEYRGYDSAGIAYIQNGDMQVVKEKGKVETLRRLVRGSMLSGNGSAALAHTRWATHGAPSQANAHPHVDDGKRLAMVHNGIIENHRALRRELEADGLTFSSQTDSEVLVKLIGREMARHDSVRSALAAALARVEGSYAVVLLSRDEPGRLWGARSMSPLVLGVGPDECFLASDVPAFLEHTREVVHLGDGELVEACRGRWTVYDTAGLVERRPEPETILWDVQAAKKGGFPHFMLKEIMEQPRVIRDSCTGRVDADSLEVRLEEIDRTPLPSRLVILACGTSYYAGLWGKYVMESLARLPVEVNIASEFRYADPVLEEGAQVLVISQSGETADTLAGLHLAHDKGRDVLGMCNVVGSTIFREADTVLTTQAGPEISVASTKAMCSQMVMLLLMALSYARRKGTLADEDRAELLRGLLDLPETLVRVLPKLRSRAHELARKYAHADNFLFLGRGCHYPLALEGALKLKEISYIHAEGYAAGEMKHGPIALVDPRFPTLAIAPRDALHAKVASNLLEIKARSGRVVALTNPGHDLEVDDAWELPHAAGPLYSFLVLPALQLFAYEAAVALGRDVDQPRNLAKSVTVE